MGNRIREFVAEEFWFLIGVVTFAMAGLVAVTRFGTLSAVIAVIGWFLLAPIFLFWGKKSRKHCFVSQRDRPMHPVLRSMQLVNSSDGMRKARSMMRSSSAGLIDF